ncbi:MAG: sulfotransferase [Deinococcales bacterium]
MNDQELSEAIPSSAFGLVLGFPRSGTTLLRLLLDAHPDISCPPEPWLTTACAKFIREIPATGPSVGVLTGLGFSGITEAEILGSLRDLVFKFHRQMAAGKKISIEKSGFDIFYLEELERLFAGHAKFITLIRHPLDVVASMKTLSDEMGIYMPELHRYIQRYADPLEAFAEAWIEKTQALTTFLERHAAQSFYLRYEDLLANPLESLNELMHFLGCEPFTQEQLASALASNPRIGLGDWKVYETYQLEPAKIGQWQKKLSRHSVTKLLPRLEPLISAHGYDLPRLPKPVEREKAMQQFKVTMSMRRSSALKTDRET